METTPIIRQQLSVQQNTCQPGTSGQPGSSYHQATSQPGLSHHQDSGHSVPGHVKGKGKGNGKKKIIPFVANDIQNHCEDNDGNFKVPHRASNSSFSTTVDLEEDDNEKTTLVNQNDDGFIEDEYVPQN